MWWGECDLACGGVQCEGPAAFVCGVVVCGAERDHVVKVGWATGFPVVDVVDLAVVVWRLAVGDRACSVDCFQRSPLLGSGEPFTSPHIDGDARSVEDEWDDLGFAGEAALFSLVIGCREARRQLPRVGTSFALITGLCSVPVASSDYRRREGLPAPPDGVGVRSRSSVENIAYTGNVNWSDIRRVAREAVRERGAGDEHPDTMKRG